MINRINPSPAIVIGAGFAGLVAAIRPQAKGFQTILLEKNDRPGGRAQVLEDGGFTFDLGPTVITAPFLLEELFELGGSRMADHISLKPCKPFYRIHLHDGSTFDYGGSEAEVVEEIRRFSAEDARRYPAFARIARKFCDRAFVDMADRPFFHLTDMLRVAPELAWLRADRSVYRLVSQHLKHPLLRQVFSFNPLLVGGNPFNVSAVYSMIHHLEREWGMHYVQGGTHKLISALVDVFIGMGGELRLNCPVRRITVSEGAVSGVETEDGQVLASDLVISNADVANTYMKLIDPVHRRKWTDRRIKRMDHSMSLLLIAFGTDRRYEHLAHHSIILGKDFKGVVDDIFKHRRLPVEPSIYLHAPSRSDDTVAPAGHDAYYALVPVPHLGADINWEIEKESFTDSVFDILEKICPALRQHVVVKHVFTPGDWKQRFDCYLGTGFEFEPTLFQSAWFRPHNKSEDVEGLYLVGAGTHPGAGIPGVLSSAKMLERLIGAP